MKKLAPLGLALVLPADALKKSAPTGTEEHASIRPLAFSCANDVIPL